MEKPDYAPDSIGEILLNCWKPEPDERPSFKQLEEINGGCLKPELLRSFYLNFIPPTSNLHVKEDK